MVMSERKVVWISRHAPLPSQLSLLMNNLGFAEVVIIPKTFNTAEEVMEEIRRVGAKAAVVVLPLSMIAHLLPLARREGVRLLWAEMQPPPEHPGPADRCLGPGKCPIFNRDTDVWLPLAGTDVGRHLRFKAFHEIIDIKLELRPLASL